ncbi:hypothetical protein [Streptomyces sp. PR69]|uniref:hypothetical protein n=1 Tax=Streptomyces sp. PR69 TaxID=2984950 RepID=UPI002263ADBB|nr:hypothetical protein [Streptomyces sp. PR69]
MRLRNAVTVTLTVTAAAVAPVAVPAPLAAAALARGPADIRAAGPPGPAAVLVPGAVPASVPGHAPKPAPAAVPGPVPQVVPAPSPARAPVPVPAPVLDPASPEGGGPDRRGSAGRQPSCGDRSDPEFPIETRVQDGPGEYRPGGGFQEWSLDLGNTTRETCHNIHPVVVFTPDDPAALTADRLRLEFQESEAGRWRPVALEKTSEDEIVGVVDAPGFPGFAVPARDSVPVRMRLAFDAETRAPVRVTANAAVVQRKGGDGDWVGESGDYRFAVLDDDAEEDEPAGVLKELAATGAQALPWLGAGAAAVALCGAGLLLAARRTGGRRRG